MSGALPIEAVGLAKTYRLGFWLSKRVHALERLDLQVHPAEVFGLLGPNGAGKSTTIKLLLDLVQPTQGTATLFGLPPSGNKARRAVGYLPENPAPYEYLTGYEFVRLAGALHGLSGRELKARLDEVLAMVGMERAASILIRRYSKGMIQRIALAQALIHKPALLILDEPTSGLDPLGRRLMRDIIVAERQRGTTVLFCTHIISDAEAVCDRIAVLVGGRVVRSGTTAELLRAQVPVVEVVLEGLTLEQVRAMAPEGTAVLGAGGQVVAKLGDERAQALVKRAVSDGARIASVQPIRFSLEDLFMSALKEAKGGTVGSHIE